MSYQVFARKYRPRTFADVLGQDHVVTTLQNAIEGDRLAHAYLFVGPRGTGKTSTARIFAKALNCSKGPRLDFDPDEEVCLEIAEGRSLDVLEIDGASNNGVEQVRELRETVNYAPASGKFKIYYIDEVHMLTNQAFNALLKTLEEPPAHVKFIFATTEPNKILPTILSRCQRFDLRPIPTGTIARHLRHIADSESVALTETAAWAIAKGADGGMRDAQSMLDQLVAFCGESIGEEDVQDIFGFTSSETVASLAASIFRRDSTEGISIVHAEANRGKDLSQLLSELTGFLRALLIGRLNPEIASEEVPADFWDCLGEDASHLDSERLLAVLDRLADADARMRRASNKQLHFEIALIRAAQSLDEVRISDVVKALGKGVPPDPEGKAPAPDPSLAQGAVDSKPAAQDQGLDKGTALRPASRTSRKTDAEGQLASLIEQAPDSRPETSPPEKATSGVTGTEQPGKQPLPAQSITEESGTRDPASKDGFYDDPLVHDALRIFEGKLKE